jgi:predicted RNA-binding protein associated with RNAse of E/G family
LSDPTTRRWEPGETVLLREVWRERIWTARPAIAVRDDDDLAAFCIPPGTRWKAPVRWNGTALRLPEDNWRLVDRLWTGHRILSFAWPDVAHAVLLFWEHGTDAFEGWYVNLQTPLRRSAVGFDYFDHALDALIAPDRSSWSWKDEDELEEAVARGIFTTEEASAFREEGERAVRRVLDREPPFDEPWEEWRPDPAWRVPTFPIGWDEL